ncbi:MAG TPA: DNA methyltransferase [Steroidobacteraceae bacterium]|nr:DNA methyltransferase [Steroidobacteraceae bacterium]
MGSKIYTETDRRVGTKLHAEKKHGALVHAAPSGPLLTVEKARQFLAQSKNVDEVRDVADKAKAVAMYLRTIDASLESQNDALEIQLRAQRRAAQIADRLPKQTGGDAAKARSKNATELNVPPTLEDRGIDKRDLSQWRKLADIPDKKFDELVEAARKNSERVTANTITQAAKLKKQAATRTAKEQAAKAAPERAVLERADAFAWLRTFEASSIDAIITDPPYSTDVDDIETFSLWIGTALQKLKPTGRLYACIGAYPRELLAYLEALQTFDVLDRSQVLSWTYRNTLGPSPSHDYKLNWQAIIYVRGIDAPPLDCPVMIEQFSVQDINAPDGRLGDRYHAWQKPDELAERLVRHSTRPGDLVVDPFACTGTFLLAAARLGRRARGCDISADNLKIAEQRGCLVEAA